jgi:hypothetical protein
MEPERKKGGREAVYGPLPAESGVMRALSDGPVLPMVRLLEGQKLAELGPGLIIAQEICDRGHGIHTWKVTVSKAGFLPKGATEGSWIPHLLLRLMFYPYSWEECKPLSLEVEPKGKSDFL